MKKLSLVILALTLAICAYPQKQSNSEKLTGKSTNTKFSGFGGPIVNYTKLHDSHAWLLGGRGGVIVNHKFAFGGIGMGQISKLKFTGSAIEGNSPMQLQSKMGAGGVFVEYFINPGCPVVFSVPVNIMAGGISINKVENSEKIESSGLFLIEPGINIALPVCKNFMPAINISYRQVLGSSLVNLDNKELSGLNIGMVFKFGEPR